MNELRIHVCTNKKAHENDAQQIYYKRVATYLLNYSIPHKDNFANEDKMTPAFHRRLRFRRNFLQRVWDFRVTADGKGFWATVWQTIKEAWREDFR